MGGLLPKASLSKYGLVKGVITSKTNGYKVIFDSSKIQTQYYSYNCLCMLSSYENQKPILVFISVQNYNGSMSVNIEKINSVSVNSTYGPKIKYKIQGTAVKIWVFQFLTILADTDISTDIVASEPDSDAIEADLN